MTIRRSAAFDNIVGGALRVLNEPQVIEALRASALEPEAIDAVRGQVESAFLPNVRLGRASTPRKYRGTNHIAVLPLIGDEEKGIAMAPSMYQLSPRRLVSIARALREQDPSLGNDQTAASAHELGERALRYLREDPVGSFLRFSASARCQVRGYTSGDLHVLARPNIFVRTSNVEAYDNSHERDIYVAAMLGHEELHGYDFEEIRPTDNPPISSEHATFRESRGYHFSVTLVNALGQYKRKEEDGFIPWDAEAARLRHNLDPETPFATPPALVQEFIDFGVI